MRTIWKFPISPEGNNVSMPRGAELLHVDVQVEQPASTTATIEQLTLWALVDSTAPVVVRRILVAGTGWLTPSDDVRYVGSAIMHRAGLVWHVFDGGEL